MGSLILAMLICTAPDLDVEVSVAIALARAEETSVVKDSLTTPSLLEAPPLPASKVLRYERRCGPDGCVEVPVYEEVEPAAEQTGTNGGGWRRLFRRRP